MRTEEIKIYTFAELSEEAKEKAIADLYDINIFADWYDSVYYDAKEIGLKITSFDLDRNRHTKGEFTLSANKVAANIMQKHGENCETYKTAAKFMEEWQPVFNEYMDESSEKYESSESETELMDIEEDFLNDLLEDYAAFLQREYDYLQSDEAIIETIEANEYEFLEDGTQYA